jgi:hypothetical protein
MAMGSLGTGVIQAITIPMVLRKSGMTKMSEKVSILIGHSEKMRTGRNKHFEAAYFPAKNRKISCKTLSNSAVVDGVTADVCPSAVTPGNI